MISPLLICCQVVPRSGHSHVSKGPLRMLFLVMPIRIKGVLGMYSMPSNLNSPLIGVMSVQTVPPSAVWAIVVVCRSDTATRPLFASENDTLVTAGSGVCATSQVRPAFCDRKIRPSLVPNHIVLSNTSPVLLNPISPGSGLGIFAPGTFVQLLPLNIPD